VLGCSTEAWIPCPTPPPAVFKRRGVGDKPQWLMPVILATWVGCDQEDQGSKLTLAKKLIPST
jgi:hypothetical protein